MAEFYQIKNGVMRVSSYFDGEIVEFTRCGSTRLTKGNAVCIEDCWWVANVDCVVVGWLDDGTPVIWKVGDCPAKNTTQLRKGE